MAEERKGAVTMRGNPMTLVGPEIKAGQKAPDFHSPWARGSRRSGSTSSRARSKSSAAIPSIDTPVCDAQTRRFNEEASKLPGDVQILTISMDLPFAQARWCGAAGVDKVTDDQRLARGRRFGKKYGVLIKELRSARARGVRASTRTTTSYTPSTSRKSPSSPTSRPRSRRRARRRPKRPAGAAARATVD